MSPWTASKILRMRELAASGMHAGDIAKDVGRTQLGIIQYCTRHEIDVVKYSAEQQAVFDGRLQAREEKRNARKRARNAKKKLEARLSQMARSGHTKVAVKAAASPTSVGFRAHLPLQREMTKTELREMLAQAVRNTAEMSA